MMKLEIRNGSLEIEGYVNAVERYSKEITEKGKSFTEKIESGAFTRALEKNKSVKMLFNHNTNRVLAKQDDNTLELKEDNIGLRVRAIINDTDVIEEAKKGHLTGWSFGFRCLEDIWDNEQSKRTVKELYLDEVSILNIEPAYVGTSIELRTGEDNYCLTEIRSSSNLEFVKTNSEETKQPEFKANETREYQELESFLQTKCLP